MSPSNALGSPERWHWFDPKVGEVVAFEAQTWFEARRLARVRLRTDEIRLLQGPFT